MIRSWHRPPDAAHPTGEPTNRGGEVAPENLRKLPSLPETAEEIQAVATTLSARPGQIYLRERATVSEVRSLDASGTLAHARVVLFATHALVAPPRSADGSAVAGLVLTPPPQGRETPDDNGFLASSDVAGLHFDADWIVLSACNTAAESQFRGHPIAGLARAFFYAGSDALLVSHWNVESAAAARLVTLTVQNSSKGGDKAHALSEAMLSVLADRYHGANAHPAIWAPFFVIGD